MRNYVASFNYIQCDALVLRRKRFEIPPHITHEYNSIKEIVYTIRCAMGIDELDLIYFRSTVFLSASSSLFCCCCCSLVFRSQFTTMNVISRRAQLVCITQLNRNCWWRSPRGVSDFF